MFLAVATHAEEAVRREGGLKEKLFHRKVVARKAARPVSGLLELTFQGRLGKGPTAGV